MLMALLVDRPVHRRHDVGGKTDLAQRSVPVTTAEPATSSAGTAKGGRAQIAAVAEVASRTNRVAVDT
jgi:hypothetical protein